MLDTAVASLSLWFPQLIFIRIHSERAACLADSVTAKLDWFQFEELF